MLHGELRLDLEMLVTGAIARRLMPTLFLAPLVFVAIRLLVPLSASRVTLAKVVDVFDAARTSARMCGSGRIPWEAAKPAMSKPQPPTIHSWQLLAKSTKVKKQNFSMKYWSSKLRDQPQILQTLLPCWPHCCWLQRKIRENSLQVPTGFWRMWMVQQVRQIFLRVS